MNEYIVCLRKRNSPHIEIGKLKTNAKDPVTLYVSGGNTIISAFNFGRYRIFGETLDIALGNCLDVFSREAGLKPKKGLPLGAVLEKLAIGGKNLISMPYVVKGMDVSYSGLLTAAISMLAHKKHRLQDLCYSIQENAFAMVCEVTERTLAHTEKKDILLTGGVAANKRLQCMLGFIAQDHGVNFNIVPQGFATDHGAMIAWNGLLAYRNGIVTPIEKSMVKLRWRLDRIDIPWIK